MAESHSQTVDDKTQTGDHGVMTDALHSLGPGNVHQAQSKDHGVEMSLSEDYETYSRIGNDAEAADALIALAESYTVQSKYPEAERALIKANDIQSCLGNDIGIGDACVQLGGLYSEQCRYEEAERSYGCALAAYDRADGSGDKRGTALAGLTLAYRDQGKYFEAEESATECLAIWTSLSDVHCQAGALILLSNIFKSQSKYDDEKEALLQAEIGLAMSGDAPRRAAVSDRLAEIYFAQADYTSAERFYRVTLAIYLSIGDNHGAIVELTNLVKLYAHQGRHEELKQCAAQARAIYSVLQASDEGQAGASPPSPQTLKSLPDSNKQKETLIQAEATFAQSGSSGSRALALAKLGNLHFEQAKYTDAEGYYRLAQSIFSSIGDEEGAALMSLRISWLYFRQARFEEAEACAAQARVWFASIADDEGEATAVDLMMSLQLCQFKLAELKELYRDACEIYTRLGRPISSVGAFTRAILASDGSESPVIELAASILRSDFPIDF